MNSLDKITLDHLLQRIKTDYPSVLLVKSDQSWWDPSKKIIYYKQKDDGTSYWSLLHELGHMVAEHSTYKTDLELISLESEAWSEAQVLGKRYGITIENDYIEDCMDSYRDWLHKRSLCPSCSQNGFQKTEKLYMCLNCNNQWTVSRSRFCRAYRSKLK